ncbi:MAG: hypothetical protein HQK79_22815 [Desulfobacterales bacterium]|nr:hypothetical protein [Desulfobacterales bacterium]MBF0399013.1 hypothetical protein [Desulfobacterales bacterium]
MKMYDAIEEYRPNFLVKTNIKAGKVCDRYDEFSAYWAGKNGSVCKVKNKGRKNEYWECCI